MNPGQFPAAERPAGRWSHRHGDGLVTTGGAGVWAPGRPTESKLFGLTSNTLVRSSQSSSGPAGGAFDGYGLGRGAAGPDRRRTTTVAGALRVIV